MTITPEAPADAALSWMSRLSEHGDAPALVTADETVSYAELARRVDQLAARLSGPRRLALLEAGATTASVVGYLGALAAGHVVLLAAPGPDGPAARLSAAYDPDLRLGSDGSVSVLRARSTHELHPQLALLLSTSGSTGSAKLVRLSATNLAANTEQIAEYLGIRPDDRAALTLPLTYCYGLSVLTTHLARGASVVLTELSVVDECFWRLFREAGATTFPGVPHTFELLERSGFADRDLPHLRYVTQAGGRMEPDRVRSWAALGRQRGWDLFVMYGQSEATARMTYLPPDLAVHHPDSVGVAVPGASVSIDDGEIVFDGPNVMLGYAHRPEDLALGRTVEVLRTGDLGRLTPEGLLQVTGRRARFIKVLGHRIDLDGLERRLRASGHDVRCAGRDGLLVLSTVGAATAPARERVRRAAVMGCGAPADAVRVVPVADHPTLPSGKPDYAAVLASAPTNRAGDPADLGTTVAELYAALLHRDDVPDDATFAGLGGDSLSYVEVSIRLEELLGRLPASWHVTPVAELEALRADDSPARTSAAASEHHGAWLTGGPRRATSVRRIAWRDVESSVWLRALAILLIVATHADLVTLQGSANALLVVAGYQLVRFQLSAPDRAARVRGICRAVARIVAPTLVVIVGAHVLGGYYETRNFFLANWVVGEPHLGPPWRFWFIEALVWALLLTAGLSALPWFTRLERRLPLSLPLALTAAAFVLLRLPVLPLPVPHMQGSAHVVLYLFFLGWALARVTTLRQRLLVSLVVVASIGTFSFNERRDGLTIALVLVLAWFPVTRVPAALVPVIRPLAAASLYIYVIHWQALEVLWGHPVPAFAGSLAIGLGYWWAWTRLAEVVGSRMRRLTCRVRPAPPGSTEASGPRTAAA
ncbi:MAG TPA: AMP-binding protein [Actinomycetales bacterium]|nr:AMP-binding protein [Actinomycetales bacterium]